MAEKSKIAADARRRAVVARYAQRREALKHAIADPSTGPAARAAAMAELRSPPYCAASRSGAAAYPGPSEPHPLRAQPRHHRLDPCRSTARSAFAVNVTQRRCDGSQNRCRYRIGFHRLRMRRCEWDTALPKLG
ncbi:hypothetical protein Raf01_83820 [Rugosimonospora africana]|uniref:30S ribosomal protein S14 n=1 Tax=Rugosimonospora africana TaxID=556532 RepID=A0A8J3R2K3_9ACTN|nr:hypothetical protein Raf01_83820 [Rugosimonospora africana]